MSSFEKKPDSKESMIQFGQLILGQDPNGTEINDSGRLLLMRGLVDAGPKVSADILREITERSKAVASLLNWISCLEGGPEVRSSKFKGLFDTYVHMNELHLFLEELFTVISQQTVTKGNYSNNECNELIELANDPQRLSLLVQACAGNPEQLKRLLRVKGTIKRSEENEVFFHHGLLKAASKFRNKDSMRILLEAIESSGMSAEMFIQKSFLEAFRNSSLSGDIDSLESILRLCDEAVKRDDSAALEESPDNKIKLKTVLSTRNKHFGLDEEAGVLDHFILGARISRRNRASSTLALALSSNDSRTIAFFTDKLKADPACLIRVGKAMYSTLKARQDLAKKLEIFDNDSDGNDEYEIPEKVEDFLSELSRQIEEQDEIIALFMKLFNTKLKASIPTSLTTNIVNVDGPPEGCDPDTFFELIQIMTLLDHMNQAKGEGLEWARRLSVLFKNTDDAKTFLRSAIKWALNNQDNARIWRHHTDSPKINWPDEIGEFARGERVVPVDAITAAMSFDFPQDSFVSDPWRSILLESPEAAHYLNFAPQIEAYCSNEDQKFPRSIEELRSLVLDLHIKSQKIPKTLADKLRARLKTDYTSEGDDTKSFRSASNLTAVIPPALKTCIEHLAMMGVLGASCSTLWGDELYNEGGGQLVTMEDGSFRLARRDASGRREEATFQVWPAQEYQTVIPKENGTSDSAILADLLNATGALAFWEQSIVIDLESLPNQEDLEFIKQLCISLIQMSPESGRRTLLIEPFYKDTIEAIIQKILSTTKIEDVFKIFSKTDGPVSFHEEDEEHYRIKNIVFRLKFERFSGKEISRQFKHVNELIKYVIQLIGSNLGRARNIIDTDLNKLSAGFYLGEV
jgi:hypothetical protein